jgi:hypothetical protein
MRKSKRKGGAAHDLKKMGGKKSMRMKRGGGDADKMMM